MCNLHASTPDIHPPSQTIHLPRVSYQSLSVASQPSQVNLHMIVRLTVRHWSCLDLKSSLYTNTLVAVNMHASCMLDVRPDAILITSNISTYRRQPWPNPSDRPNSRYTESHSTPLEIHATVCIVITAASRRKPPDRNSGAGTLMNTY